ncbi:unnamed protein product [Brachionus calyciflorus]|uniref:CAP-Gly domain-containing protein n=1 Tax=Brachionus calyciflorus TaxID=104777 RepID=A0A813WN86_9BILA|nr:unnamed protein product [Brachionus calyciflorus]
MDEFGKRSSFKMDLDSEIVELFDQESFSIFDPFQIESEMGFLDLTENMFIETSTPTEGLFENKYKQNFKINDLVCINDKKCGYLKFKGRVHFAEGYFCGIELIDRDGKHDGKIDNIRYGKFRYFV